MTYLDSNIIRHPRLPFLRQLLYNGRVQAHVAVTLGGRFTVMFAGFTLGSVIGLWPRPIARIPVAE
jgi:hypothetical protein